MKIQPVSVSKLRKAFKERGIKYKKVAYLSKASTKGAKKA